MTTSPSLIIRIRFLDHVQRILGLLFTVGFFQTESGQTQRIVPIEAREQTPENLSELRGRQIGPARQCRPWRGWNGLGLDHQPGAHAAGLPQNAPAGAQSPVTTGPHERLQASLPGEDSQDILAKLILAVRKPGRRKRLPAWCSVSPLTD
jgi:hypothetical protein